MNTGVISSRYAKALLKLVDETGNGPQVCEQVKLLLEDPEKAASMQLCDELQRFVRLLMRNERSQYLKMAFVTFLDLYRDSRNIHSAHLTTAVPAPALEKRLADLVREKTGGEVELHSEVDPSVIGGFIFEIDDYMVDASVSRKIEGIRRQFIDRNNRIV